MTDTTHEPETDAVFEVGFREYDSVDEVWDEVFVDDIGRWQTYDAAVADAMSRGEGWYVTFVRGYADDFPATVWPENETELSADDLRRVRGTRWRVTTGEAVVVAVPAGSYFVGDPCYAVPDDMWRRWLEVARADRRSTGSTLVGEIGGHTVVAFATMHGDGVYVDQLGGHYCVDAGILGVTPLEVAEPDSLDRLAELGRVVTFAEGATTLRLGGLLSLGPYRIALS